MSCWLHVAGVMRIDDIRLGYDAKDPDFDEVIGKECHYDDDEEVWDDFQKHPENYLPMGSEGSLRKSVWINPDKSHCAAYTVTIFGDLRDRYKSDADMIISWFKDKCDKLSIRDAFIIVRYSSTGIKSYIYKRDE